MKPEKVKQQSICRWGITIAAFLFSFLFYNLSITSAQEDDWWQIKESQFDYDKYQEALGKIETNNQFLKDFTHLLVKSSDQAELRRIGDFRMRLIPEGEDVTFKTKGKNLKEFQQLLEWGGQHIGLANAVITLKGYGYVSQKQILELKIENLKLKHAPNVIIESTQKELEVLQAKIDAFTAATHWED
jgi:hypothetical protein